MKNQYFTVIALEEGELKVGEGFLINDGRLGWRSIPTEIGHLEVEAGDRIMIAADEDTDVLASELHLETTFKYMVEGNIMSLSYGHRFRGQTEIQTEKEYEDLFRDDKNLISAENLVLPATDLAEECYSSMFWGCANLTFAPKTLPAKTLEYGCYLCMFYDCYSLIAAPELPSEELAKSCYYCMFQNCKALKKAPKLPAMKMAEECYYGMFWGCTSLTTAPALPAFELADYCYSEMFRDCYSLQTAPILPAEKATEGCYASMFENCIKLEKIPAVLPIKNVEQESIDAMYHNCLMIKDVPTTPLLPEEDNIWSGLAMINKRKPEDWLE